MPDLRKRELVPRSRRRSDGFVPSRGTRRDKVRDRQERRGVSIHRLNGEAEAAREFTTPPKMVIKKGANALIR
jgi:hypothetical protein